MHTHMHTHSTYGESFLILVQNAVLCFQIRSNVSECVCVCVFMRGREIRSPCVCVCVCVVCVYVCACACACVCVCVSVCFWHPAIKLGLKLRPIPKPVS